MKPVTLKKLTRKLKALSDPTRMKLLAMLSNKPLCVCELTHALGFAQPTVSRHLQQLEDAGFVTRTRQGTWIIYTLEPADEVSQELLDTVMDHAVSDPECRELIESLKNIDRCSLSGDGRVRKEGAE